MLAAQGGRSSIMVKPAKVVSQHFPHNASSLVHYSQAMKPDTPSEVLTKDSLSQETKGSYAQLRSVNPSLEMNMNEEVTTPKNQ